MFETLLRGRSLLPYLSIGIMRLDFSGNLKLLFRGRAGIYSTWPSAGLAEGLVQKG